MSNTPFDRLCELEGTVEFEQACQLVAEEFKISSDEVKEQWKQAGRFKR